MNTGSLRLPRSRVYTIVAALILALSVGVAAPASMRITVEAAMTRGLGDAPVTVIEFSDYQ